MGVSLFDVADFTGAEPLSKRALEINQKIIGDAHPETAKTMSNLARLFRDINNFEIATELYLKAFVVRFDCWGKENSETIRSFETIVNFSRSCPPEFQKKIANEIRKLKIFHILELDLNYRPYIESMG